MPEEVLEAGRIEVSPYLHCRLLTQRRRKPPRRTYLTLRAFQGAYSVFLALILEQFLLFLAYVHWIIYEFARKGYISTMVHVILVVSRCTGVPDTALGCEGEIEILGFSFLFHLLNSNQHRPLN